MAKPNLPSTMLLLACAGTLPAESVELEIPRPPLPRIIVPPPARKPRPEKRVRIGRKAARFRF